MLLIKDIVLTENISVELHDTLEDAIKVMCDNRQGVVVVISNNIPVGVLTERDILHIINTDVNYSSQVSTILNLRNLITVNSKRTIEYALHLLIDNNIRRLVVVDDKNTFVGIITQDMLIKHLEEDSFQTNMIISHFIKTPKSIVCVDSKSKLSDAFEIMNENNIGSVVVQNEKKEPIGIVTEKDAIYFINDKGDLTADVTSVMSYPVVCVEENDKVRDVVLLMEQKSIRRVLVVDEKSQPKSVLTVRDIAQNLKGNYGHLLEIKLKNVKRTLNYIGESILEIVEDNSEQVIQWMNEKAVENFGNLVDRSIIELIKSDLWNDIYAKVKELGKCEKCKINIRGLHFEMMCSYHYIKNKETLLIILRDISEFENAIIDAKKDSENLIKEINILQGVIDQQNNIVLVSDGTDIVSANKKFFDFFQVESLAEFKKIHNSLPETFISHKNFFSPSVDENWIEKIQTLSPKDRVVSIVELQSVEPKAFTVQLNKLSSDERNYVITLTDITDIKIESQKHYFNATHDALTGIYNRAYFLDAIKEELEKARRYKSIFSVILFDVDYFKKFNDNYGHLKGDEVLKRLAKVIDDNIRKSDVFSRWGGEEFIILLPETSLEKAELLAENLRKKLHATEIKGVPRITASFGVSQFAPKDDRNTLIKRADDALYNAKDSGRNCVKSK